MTYDTIYRIPIAIDYYRCGRRTLSLVNETHIHRLVIFSENSNVITVESLVTTALEHSPKTNRFLYLVAYMESNIDPEISMYKVSDPLTKLCTNSDQQISSTAPQNTSQSLHYVNDIHLPTIVRNTGTALPNTAFSPSQHQTPSQSA
jgi:hypothetical protein